MNANETVPFFDILSEFFAKILPIVGVIVLIALVFLVWEIIKFIRGLSTTVDKVNDTITTVDKSVQKLQAPLNTVESLSYTIDSVHVVSKRAVNKSVATITDNYAIIKDWVGTFFNDKKEKKTEVEVDLPVNAVKVREDI